MTTTATTGGADAPGSARVCSATTRGGYRTTGPDDPRGDGRSSRSFTSLVRVSNPQDDLADTLRDGAYTAIGFAKLLEAELGGFAPPPGYEG